jgi:hypothetical protein
VEWEGSMVRGIDITYYLALNSIYVNGKRREEAEGLFTF